MTEIEKHYTTEQVAELFEVGAATVRQWIRDKKLAAIKLPGSGRIRVPESAVRNLANQKYGAEDVNTK